MKLSDWLDREAIVSRLTSRGMNAECAANAAPCFQQAATSLQRTSVDPAADVVACWAPGRIEVLGKHTDYCGGASILAAVERGFCMLAAPRNDGHVTIVDPQYPFREVVLNKTASPILGHWSNYPHTVVRRLVQNFPNARRGAKIAFASNLPPSSGMSSSSAFVVGTFLLLSRINDLERDPNYAAAIRTREDLAGYLGTVENGASFGPLAGDRGVGTFGGSEDHTAILCGQPNRLVEYAYCPVRFRRTIELANDYAFAIASSGVVAEKTGTALENYNRISAMVRTIISTWQSTTGRDEQSMAAILTSLQGDSGKLRDILAAHTDATVAAGLVERLNHFTMETRLMNAVPYAINASTIGTFGEAAYESHSMAHRHLKNQTAETDRIVELAKEFGAPAASAFGAGFGGSVWAILDRTHVGTFLKAWKSKYQLEFPTAAQQSEFFSTRPGVSAFTLE